MNNRQPQPQPQPQPPTPRYVRLSFIVGKPGQPGLLPVSRSTWLAWEKAGSCPKGIKINGVKYWDLAQLLRFAEGRDNG